MSVERRSGVPLRFSLPAAITCLSLLAAVAGAYWDVGYHAVSGPGERTLITVPHMLVLGGINAGFVAVWLHARLRGPRVPGELTLLSARLSLAPGAILILVCVATAFIAFVFDDFWHRMLGSDPTIWGPTHLVLIVTSAFASIGAWSLVRQGRLLATGSARPGLAEVWIAGTLLLSLSLIQAEFDFGTPSFRLLFHPVILAFTAALALVCARFLLGPGGALKVLAFFLVFRAAVAVAVGPVLGDATPHFPIYIAEAIAVEVAGLLAWRSPLRFALASAFGIGTVGMAAEYAWSHVWMTYGWPPSLLLEGLPLALAAGAGGALLGVRIAQALGRPRGISATPKTLRAPAMAAAGVALLLALVPLLPRTGPDGTSASYVATPAPTGGVDVTVAVHPAEAARGAEWLKLVSLGEGRRETTALRAVSGGRYEVADPVPVGGDWAWELRLADGSDLMAASLALGPRPDTGVNKRPAALTGRVTGSVRLERDTPGGLGNGDLITTLAYVLVSALAVAWLVLMIWSLRLVESSSARLGLGRPRQVSEPAAVGAPMTSSV